MISTIWGNDPQELVIAKASGGGGSGTITEITSSDASINVVNPNGPITDITTAGLTLPPGACLNDYVRWNPNSVPPQWEVQNGTNTLLGCDAGLSSALGSSNVGISGALKLSSGSRNIAVGINAVINCQNDDHIGIGVDAGANCFQGKTISIGTSSGENSEEGAVCCGYRAGYTNSGLNSVCVGIGSGNGSITVAGRTGDLSVAVGGYSNTTEADNSISVGQEATTENCDNAIAIGYQAQTNNDNEIVIKTTNKNIQMIQDNFIVLNGNNYRFNGSVYGKWEALAFNNPIPVVLPLGTQVNLPLPNSSNTGTEPLFNLVASGLQYVGTLPFSAKLFVALTGGRAIPGLMWVEIGFKINGVASPITQRLSPDRYRNNGGGVCSTFSIQTQQIIQPNDTITIHLTQLRPGAPTNFNISSALLSIY